MITVRKHSWCYYGQYRHHYESCFFGDYSFLLKHHTIRRTGYDNTMITTAAVCVITTNVAVEPWAILRVSATSATSEISAWAVQNSRPWAQGFSVSGFCRVDRDWRVCLWLRGYTAYRAYFSHPPS